MSVAEAAYVALVKRVCATISFAIRFLSRHACVFRQLTVLNGLVSSLLREGMVILPKPDSGRFRKCLNEGRFEIGSHVHSIGFTAFKSWAKHASIASSVTAWILVNVRCANSLLCT